MFKYFLLLVLLCLSQASFFRIIDSGLELKNDTKGQITLTYIQGSGYVVPATFRRGGFAENMIVSLYSSNVLLTENCFQFSRYYCSQFDNCRRDNSRTYNVNYPWFSAQGNLLSTQLFVDQNSWSLAGNAPTLIATACTTQTTGSFGANTFGLLGLGFNGNARNNFNSVVSSFSNYFSFGAFRLEFNPVINFPRRLIASVRTDQNWGIPNVQSIAIGNSVNKLTGVKAIWDLNSDAIGLPLAIFNTFVPALASYGIYCPQGVYYQPTCTFNGAIPTLSVTPDSASTILLIPQIWALNQSGNQFKLNIKALSPNMSGLNYIHPDYQYTIVLGNTVLGTYYHHFKLTSSSVDIYQPL